MKRDHNGPVLSAVFIDYDNIYLSLRRKSDEAARRFSKDAVGWLRGIEFGRLITQNSSVIGDAKRRIVMNRCYGNPMPRRNPADNTTDMHSFPFVRHHFLRAGFEVVDCPPLTAQQKNAADIRMVMDMRDYLGHETYFDEFIILSGDADFTPVLHRLRQHARKTVIYVNDHTAAAYTAIADGEVRESDLIALLLDATLGSDAQLPAPVPAAPVAAAPRPQVQPQVQAPMPMAAPAAAIDLTPPTPVQVQAQAPQVSQATLQSRLDDLRTAIMSEVIGSVRVSQSPVPLEALADRALRTVGHERTIGTAWAGAGSFRDLLRQYLPTDLRMSEQPPFVVFDTTRHLAQSQPAAVAAGYMMAEHAPQVQVAPEQIAPSHVAPARAPVMSIEMPRAAAPAEPLLESLVVPERSEPRREMQPELRQEPRPAVARQSVQRHPQAMLQQAPIPQQVYVAEVSAAPQPQPAPLMRQPQAVGSPAALQARAASSEPVLHRAAPMVPAQAPAARAEQVSPMAQSMARILDACQAPPMGPGDYRALFELLAQEIAENSLSGVQTLATVVERGKERGLSFRRDDVRFVLDAVGETDPWFEQGASTNLFAGRFRNFVVARCRDQGAILSASELDLIDAWFIGGPMPQMSDRPRAVQPMPAAPQMAPQQVVAVEAAPRQPAPAQAAPVQPQAAPAAAGGSRWWSGDDVKTSTAAADDDFPRFVKTRQRG